MRVLRIVLFAVVASVGLLGMVAGPAATRSQAQGTSVVDVVSARGVVNPTLAHYVMRSIDRAERRFMWCAEAIPISRGMWISATRYRTFWNAEQTSDSTR